MKKRDKLKLHIADQEIDLEKEIPDLEHDLDVYYQIMLSEAIAPLSGQG